MSSRERTAPTTANFIAVIAVAWFIAPLLVVAAMDGNADATANSKIQDLPRVDHPVDFVRDIQPIFRKHCQKCHGPDKQKAGLRLDHREGLLDGGDSGPAIIAGNAAKSGLLTRLTTDDEDMRMPPKGEPLTDAEVQAVRAWIDGGADWPEGLGNKPERRSSEHWAFQPIRRLDPPPVKDEKHVRNPIDRFIQARLEAEGITPSPQADRYALIRRVHLDLLGLPPTPQQVDAYVNDPRPDAYERVVDAALGSVHYGERWGRHWLDQARYADSHGYSIDGGRTMWPYRDWVINALNADMPFDRFTIEQLAGDLLEKPTQQQLIATGFHRNTLINQEGGSDPEQFRVEATVDRTNTTGAVWLGLTVGCAQCHTHKYDPITQREYYQLLAFFNSAQDRNSTSPTITIQSASQQQRLAEIDKQIAAANTKLEAHDREATNRRAAWEKTLAPEANDGEAKPVRWADVTTTKYETKGNGTLRKLDDGSLLAEGVTGNDTYTVDVAASGRITAVRLDVLPHDALPKRGPGTAGNGNFVLTAFELQVDGKTVPWAHADASHSQPGYHITATIDGDKSTGWAINVGKGRGSTAKKINQPHHAVFVLAEPVDSAGKRLTVVMRHDHNANYHVGRFRITTTNTRPGAIIVGPRDERQELIAAASTPAVKRTKAQSKLLTDAYAKVDKQRKPLADALKQLQKQRGQLDQSTAKAMVMRDLPKPRDTHVMIRGDFLRKGVKVAADTPQVLPPMDIEGRATRLDLARWLVDDRNPLTPRVTVNRVWMHHFGRGLVDTENDFGTQGTPPTYPKLLDWLAGEFVSRGWSLKKLHRLILTSAAYRRSADTRTDLAEIDAKNMLLARQNRVRVEGEIVRDLALAASGLLSDKVGGPSVHPPQPPGVYAFTQRSKSWKTSTGEDRYRRGMYTFFYRSAPHPMLTTFDAPDFQTVCTRRVRSNTPLQSLTVANDESMVEAAQALAARVLGEAHGDDASRIGRAFRLCLAREASAAELDRLAEFLEQQRRSFAPDTAAAGKAAGDHQPKGVKPAEAAAWTALARVLINLDEFITRP